MLDKAVHDVLVKDIVQLDRNLQPQHFTVVTYSVGAHGPFQVSTPAAEFTQAYIEQETNKKVEMLRGLGLLPA